MRLLPAALALVMLMMCLSSCEQDEEHRPDRNMGNPETSPTMRTANVKTMISDSGYMKYIITSPLWLVYSEAKRQHWDFPHGLHLDQLDEKFKPAASIYCDSAVYYNRERLWRLSGDVVMINVRRDSFLTQQLYWDQDKQKLYSDSFIHIVRADRVIEGYGFTSNQDMTEYRILRPQAVIPINTDHIGKGQQPAATDTFMEPTESGRRPMPPRASSRTRSLQDASTLTPVHVAEATTRPVAVTTPSPTPSRR